jgi:peptidoglycan hydrolase-like protein with peptidoglycan-binding domain
MNNRYLFEANPNDFETDWGEYEMIGLSGDTKRKRPSSAEVRRVQQALNRAMGLRLKVDGIMGSQTRSAIRSFQARQGLPVNGIVDLHTERTLYAMSFGRQRHIDRTARAAFETGNSLAELEGESSIGNCPQPPLPLHLPSPGTCTPPLAWDSTCNEGMWYLPRRGDNLTKIARLTLRKSEASRMTTDDYMVLISIHPSNSIFRVTTGRKLATQQFLPQWGSPLNRVRGAGRGFGLMFLPPIPEPGVSGPFGVISPETRQQVKCPHS